ncbi:MULTISPECIES: flavin reductase family protein [unclassified Rhodococcus (in: high G+C Gram-positive bacteria)]|uniref:flavin reductase family protein n=1 Tax=unclassified Rhodococcus (in: high G+C Gram-positive bacteria) TaxID=192944 RepID=UPI000B3D2D16|nr:MULTISPECIES: flavin reductase family protein [unclassified Rhodococcus (in: high G+C Gram-positive bacteria)]KAF0960865.1 4-nitrophenol 4-monooxygenase/4-nitrocatechol 2-monooxygenase, reductase component [Rhodococcus sp. T7]OUS92063.1 flavin reductase [Rhodococcus sp. NCIMB 12038]
MPTSSSSVQETFKDVMAHVATPVAVVTSMDGGLPFGTTVSAFTSLSMTPPMVLVSLDRGSETLELITASKKFGLNVLGRDQQVIALKFAKKGGIGKFQGVRWDVEHDLPRIAGAAGWIACHVEQLVEGGDHVVVLGNVVAAENNYSEPLTYHRRVFGTHSALEPA